MSEPSPPTADGDGPLKRPPSRRRTWLLRGAIGLLSLAVLGAAVAFLVTRGGPSAPRTAHGPPASPIAPGPQAFTFRLTHVTAVTTSRASAQAAGAVATNVQATLTSFYRAAFLEPSTWSGSVPSDAWAAFAPSLQRKARADGEALTVGRHDGTLTEISASSDSLTVKVLLDPAGRPQAAVAAVTFQAMGVLAGGEQVQVTNQASYLLQPLGGKWLIVGYPRTNTEVTGPIMLSPSPSPGLSLAPGGSNASPSSGASP